ncbi:efflux transporter outer membrane subunit [Thermodesulfobacteriota bacterium]
MKHSGIAKTTVFILTVMAAALIAGCAVGPEYKPPKVETPEEYRFEAEPAAAVEAAPVVVDLKWWELFEDPILYTLVMTALENNRDLKIAVSRIDQARAALGFTQADIYPRVDVEGGIGTGNFGGGTRSPTTSTNAFLAVPLSWELDFWGKFRRATESAKAEMLASEYAYRAVQLSLISEVVGTYNSLLDFNQRLAISKETLESREKSLHIIQLRFDKGIIHELDLNQAQIQREIAAASIPEQERSIALTENALSILLGRLPEPIETGKRLSEQIPPPDIPTGLPSDILERRPDIVEALYLVEAQTEKIGVAVALRFPSITLTGVLGVASSELASITNEGGVWSVSGGLLGPLIDFDKNLSRVRLEEARTQEALYRYENTVLNAFREVEDALVEVETYRKQIGAVGRQRKAAKNANYLSNERYDKGVSSYLEVLETERQLFNVQLELSGLTRQYLNAYVNLYKALGGGWGTKEEMEAVKAAEAAEATEAPPSEPATSP